MARRTSAKQIEALLAVAIFFTLDAEDFDHPELHAAFERKHTAMLFDPYDVIVEFRKFYGVA